MRVAVPQLPQWFGRSGSPRAWLVRGLGRPVPVGSIIASPSTTVLVVEARFAHRLPYPLMELICVGLLGGWLWLFEARLRRLAVFQATAGGGRSLLFHPARRRS